MSLKMSAVFFIVISYATAFADVVIITTQDSGLCSTIQTQGTLPVVDALFCTNSDVFTPAQMCEEMICLTEKDMSHCRPSVQIVSLKNKYEFFQGSSASEQLDSAYTQFCSSPVEND